MQQFLVVNDSRAIQAIICRAITGAGYHKDAVHAVSSGMEALALLNKFRPDLIITDWHMPGISGLELVKTLRQTGHQDIKIGMVTTELSEMRLQEARHNGVEFVLHKPFKDDELLAAIEKSVGLPSSHRWSSGAAAEAPERCVIASTEAVLAVLKTTLPSTAFRVAKADLFQLDQAQRKVLVGLYSQEDQKSVSALCIMDFACAGLIAASALGYNLAQMQSVLGSEAGAEAMTPPAATFLKEAATLFPLSDHRPYALLRWNILGTEVAPLRKALQHNAGAQAYELELRGFGHGRFVLIKFSD